MNCKREGCRKQAARGDDFCSRYCLERHNGTIEPPRGTRYQRETMRKLRDSGQYVEVANPDAMSYRAAGSFEAGKRR